MAVRDPEYYRDSGDLVILVEDKTLFRVHKGALMREASAFFDMLSAPEIGEGDGSCDDSPLKLSGDTVDEFRALCWSVYVPPREILAIFQRGSNSVFDHAESRRFLALALIAHKYMFEDTEKWARESLDRCCQLQSEAWNKRANNFLTVAALPDLLRLIKYAEVANHTILNEAILNKFIERVDANPRQLDVLDALKIAEENNWRGLQGEMYYRILCEAAREARSSAKALDIPVLLESTLPTQLSDSQKSRVMQGYMALINVYDQVMAKLHEQSLRDRYYSSAHQDYLLERGDTVSADVLEHLRLIISHFDRYSNSQWDILYQQVKNNLPAYFLGPSS